MEVGVRKWAWLTVLTTMFHAVELNVMDPRECKSDVLEVSREGVVPTFGCLWFGVRTRF